MDINKQRNILLIMCDQLRYDAVGVHGNSSIITPNIDELCENGISFGSYFTNAPVCVPSRCSLFTGRYPHSHLCRENHTVLQAGREIHLFRAAKHDGYNIGYFGKNHFLHASEFSNFDYAFIDGITPFTDGEKQCNEAISQVVKQAGSVAHKTATFHSFGKEQTKAAKWTNYAVEALKEISEKNEPFCFCLSLEEPHYPHVAPKEIWDLYEGVNFSIPQVSDEDISLKPPRYAIKQKAQHSDEASYADKQNYLRGYYSLVTLVDDQVGKIMKCLRECNLDGSTIVIFTSDHGDFGFNHGMSKKDLVLLDDLLHVPLIVKFPGETAPGRKISGTLTEEIDLMPTILEMIGADVPRGCQGLSAMPLLSGATDIHKDEVFAEINPPWLKNKFDSYDDLCDFFAKQGAKPNFNIPGDCCKSIRTLEYKYIWYSRGWEELYDIKSDPAETHNLADEEAYLHIKQALKIKLLEWNARSEEPLDDLLFRTLHEKYPNWNSEPIPNATSGWRPYWAKDEY